MRSRHRMKSSNKQWGSPRLHQTYVAREKVAEAIVQLDKLGCHTRTPTVEER